ncbi:hypothetical protein ACFFMN_02625 [Planobispora siamensis]|uniref:hypothetical protein n=1 Tax=Planobispora siamensis TaxID=936338 RepID=UPI00194F6D59|nr:hypothetical protein [Planobispora siamensis]
MGVAHVAATALRAALGKAPGGPDRAFDIVVGTGSLVGEGLGRVGRLVMTVTRPVARMVLHPPVLAPRYHPARWVEEAADRGRRVRLRGERDLERVVDALVPVVVEQALRRLDLTAVVAENVDLDALVAGVDLDAAAAHIDLGAAAARIDLDEAAARIDVDAIAARIDLDAIIARIDLAGLAEQVIDAIDLPEIIRDSTGSMTSGVVRGVRMQSIGADEKVASVFGRILRRRRSPASPDELPPVPGSPDGTPAAVISPEGTLAAVVSPDGTPAAAASSGGTPAAVISPDGIPAVVVSPDGTPIVTTPPNGASTAAVSPAVAMPPGGTPAVTMPPDGSSGVPGPSADRRDLPWPPPGPASGQVRE